ncbi:MULTISPECIES: 4-coumarate--CoA ligase family protein [Streptomyces]|uniref:Acyl-CoA synthetase (AMP-forming)/AMP-acid ligase II n=1 Tax=Streptomyces stelliscabiei TaxID=146820 RepID=A0A8I0PAC5_9ACTN|nr:MULTISPECIES: 4-coumarate--CoA ligase family protein [Streptomyces]KND45704.1 AMP-dependent synthetase [Streptomyces stelliscabiei]MBE1598113.1 acyl-CoA synthetase (AMP-forming)/AMP-acid ligase II [Streptomyces stelliscabiei]MDX2515618.1 4-coumarate--CoA ligase family protein [Streptomyces stelliscabiei]MDX2552216.1 4-coumarate--CoA ligase family protein [Streptomyces stelliscabiei]MDX2617814.1 4-coumarate--CoA ligase family protein [Streptomyces stelliscabiei]
MFRSEYADVPPVELPIHDAVLARAAEFGDLPALIDGVDGTTLTYEQVDRFHRRLAAAFAEAGVRKGDVLALHSPNTIAYPTAFYAATRAGATVTTAHPLATPGELATQLRDSGASWIVTVSPLLQTARAAAERVGGIREIFVCDSAPGHRSLIDMLAGAAPEPAVDIDPGTDVAVLPYSSGTTGVPKGVMLTHRSIATNLAQLEPVMPAGPGDRILAVLPFFHIYGLTALMNAPLRLGATVVVLPRFDLESYLAAIVRHRITHLYVAPPIVLALAKHPAAERHDLSTVRHILSAAAPLDAKLAAACSARLGLPPVVQGYGMTELSPCSHIVPLDRAASAPPGTVGRLIAGTEMRIVSLDDPGKDLGPGEPGEIVIRGPQVMKGYLGRPQATADMIDADGWLSTGDIGHTDADGWLYVVDRVKELIKYKGFQVAPAELEALLVTHPGIADAAVIGHYNDDGNEVPHAFVVRRPTDRELSEGEIMMYVAERVAPYKRVRHVTFIDAVPRAASGKILRRELRERL